MKLKLVKIKNEAKDTKTFYWQPEKSFKYLPGQFFYFSLPHLVLPDKRGATRHFTLSSSPTETLKSGLIANTTRIRDESGYKQTLAGLSIGSEIEGEGPSGTYILDENSTGNHVFLIGGIGITPIRSFLKYKLDKQLDYRSHLLYSNSTPDQITFKTELDTWAKKDKNFSVTFSVTKPTKSWKGLIGRINQSMIESLISDHQLLNKSKFWVCGPPAFVLAMEDILDSMKVNSNRVVSEKFSGY